MIARATAKKRSLAIAVAALTLVIGSGIAYADTAHIYTSDTAFEVIDPYQPNIWTNVNGGFVNQSIIIQVNMSSQEGVTQLKGTYTVVVQVWNDNASAFVDFRTLASNQPITLTQTPTTHSFSFTTDTPGYYNVHVSFTAISATSG